MQIFAQIIFTPCRLPMGGVQTPEADFIMSHFRCLGPATFGCPSAGRGVAALRSGRPGERQGARAQPPSPGRSPQKSSGPSGSLRPSARRSIIT